MNEDQKKISSLYLNGLTLKEIGKQWGISGECVRLRLIKADIPRRSSKYHFLNKDRLVRLYSVEKLPINQIADHFSVDSVVINKALKHYNIPERRTYRRGGYIVDFLRKLAPGEKKKYKLRSKSYLPLYTAAKRMDIKISLRSVSEREIEVTRVE